MNYEGILEFHGTWRSYQARVLQMSADICPTTKSTSSPRPVPAKRPSASN